MLVKQWRLGDRSKNKAFVVVFGAPLLAPIWSTNAVNEICLPQCQLR